MAGQDVGRLPLLDLTFDTSGKWGERGSLIHFVKYISLPKPQQWRTQKDPNRFIAFLFIFIENLPNVDSHHFLSYLTKLDSGAFSKVAYIIANKWINTVGQRWISWEEGSEILQVQWLMQTEHNLVIRTLLYAINTASKQIPGASRPFIRNFLRLGQRITKKKSWKQN